MKTIEDIKIGDVYYRDQGYGYKSITGVYIVERITKTQIILNDGTRIKPLLKDASQCERIGDRNVWRRTVYILENEEVKSQYELERMQSKAGKFHQQLGQYLAKLSIDELNEFIEINSKFLKG